MQYCQAKPIPQDFVSLNKSRRRIGLPSLTEMQYEFWLRRHLNILRDTLSNDPNAISTLRVKIYSV